MVYLTSFAEQSKVVMDNFFSGPTMDLLAALSKADRTRTEAALNAGAKVNEVGKQGTTPLLYAVIKLDRNAVGALLALGADPSHRQADGYNALTAAYRLETVDASIMDLLLQSRRCDPNTSMPDDEPLLYHAIGQSRNHALRQLLKYGGNPRGRTRAGRPLLIAAVLIERYDAAQILLDAGAAPDEPDAAGRTALWHAERGPSAAVDPAGQLNQERLALVARLHKLLPH